MNKISVLTLCMSLICFLSSGQDLIYTSDGSTISGMVLEWDQSQIKYEPIDIENKNPIVLSSWYIDSIRFKNGRLETFTEISNSYLPPKNLSSHTLLGFDFLSLLPANFRLTYEYKSSSGIVGYYVPLTINLSSKKTYWYDENSIGIGFKFYVPTKNKRINMATGFQLVGGQFFDYIYMSGYQSIGFINFNFSNHFSYALSEDFLIGLSVDLKLFSPYVATRTEYGWENNIAQSYLLPYAHIELIKQF